MFKRIGICLILGCLIMSGICSAAANADKQKSEANSITIDFSKFEIGKLPSGFLTAVTNDGQSGKWEIVNANGTKVLAQTSTDDTDDRFPQCVYDMMSFKDVEVSTDFMAVAGKSDQAAGLVARYKDKKNYYIVRANALEDNVRLYKVEYGKRKQIGGANIKVNSGAWHNLKLVIKGTVLKVFFDGKSVIELNDTTFQNAGMVGFWTKSDSVTYFKNIKIEK
jgi:hypothetical protein